MQNVSPPLPKPATDIHPADAAVRNIAADQQRRIDDLQSQLKQQSSLAALGELTSTATHEFNNVLMTILNYAQLGLRNRDDASRDKALNKIHDAAKRAATITNTILAQARNRGDHLCPTDLGSLIESSLVLLGRELQKHRIAVELDLGDVPAIHASGNQLQRVLMNLIINARQAMTGGGTLLIRTAATADGHVQLTVRDSGEGIPTETLPKIFDSFYTTKDGPDATGKGGTGLGLAACKEIIDAHRGRIRVESTVGRGTAFIIQLPIARAQQAA